MMDDLNASGNILLGHVMGKQVLETEMAMVRGLWFSAVNTVSLLVE